ncbi:hypothetical protein ABFS82_05G102500 [Erythranthe guttata]|uniref:putative ripening-related protein 1 n=1 Tax=Erythranthe guttata TaxID=4155 RepID=UPI00064DCC3B|nr:PREDICTED: putative ripening-related protein 1 [Erythranthe guttata]|eukprot:XP_012836258.1 PREDICTED: putative ripening-related protein 1 [Erythranthe guttata]
MAFFMRQLIVAVLIILSVAAADAQKCKPSGKIRGTKPPKDKCNKENNSECCKPGKIYDTYECSPPVSSRRRRRTKAVLTLNSFEKGGDGGGKSECDDSFHSDKSKVVALSTGWFDHLRRCNRTVTIEGNGRRATAKVVDECDSTAGCDSDHDYQPPCRNNIVDASPAVWEALGVPEKDRGSMEVFWSDGRR